MKEIWIMRTIAVSSNGAKETIYNFEPQSSDITLKELKAIAKFLNEYIEKEEKGGAQRPVKKRRNSSSYCRIKRRAM